MKKSVKLGKGGSIVIPVGLRRQMGVAVGAHAAVRGIPLLTRDAARYKTYFPQLILISP